MRTVPRCPTFGVHLIHNAYWVKRLVEFPEGKARPFAAVVIYNAYKPGAENRIEFPWRGWRLTGRTHPHFGPDEVTVFAIKLDSANVKAQPCGPKEDRA